MKEQSCPSTSGPAGDLGQPLPLSGLTSSAFVYILDAKLEPLGNEAGRGDLGLWQSCYGVLDIMLWGMES